MEKSESGVRALDLLVLSWTHPENLDGVAAGRAWKGTCQRGKGDGQASEEGGKVVRSLGATDYSGCTGVQASAPPCLQWERPKGTRSRILAQLQPTCPIGSLGAHWSCRVNFERRMLLCATKVKFLSDVKFNS